MGHALFLLFFLQQYEGIKFEQSYGIAINVVSSGLVQSGYISPEVEAALIPDMPMRRVGRSEDIGDAVVFFASEQADWITGQLIFVHGDHRMNLGQ